MNTRAVIALALAGFLAPTAWAGDVPTTFARSGGPVAVAVTVGDDSTPGNVVLRAFGRTWTEPAAVMEGKAKIETPAVRVPTVFSVVSPDEPDRPCGYLIAYPETDPPWKPEDLRVYAVGAPTWFDEWARAVNAPVVTVSPKGLGERERKHDGGELLVLGRESAGAGLAELVGDAGRYGINILVLKAEWFGETVKEEIVVAAGASGGLSELRSQRWPRPLAFSCRSAPMMQLCNRRMWIGWPGRPLVEEAGDILSSHRVVLSYVPWAEQIGRREEADATLVALLVASSQPPAVAERILRRARVAFPSADELKSDERPVLARIAEMPDPYVRIHRPFPSVAVLDVRGGPVPSEGPRNLLAAFEPGSTPVLILGDDPLLDRLKWLRLNRSKKSVVERAGQPHVEWLPDDALPPSAEAQVRLMEALTEFGVRLVVPLKEESK